jgi:hypothetical protein
MRQGKSVPRCIYCLEDKPDECFRKTEHAMSQSFGKFEQNLTLNGVVCDECNQYFGDTLELVLGRDTNEGLARVQHGVKSPKEFKALRKGRVVLKIAEGPFKGCYAYLQYSETAGKVQIFRFPQVGFLILPSNAYEFFLLDEIPSLEDLRRKGFSNGTPRSIFGVEVEAEVLVPLLAEKGIPFRSDGDFDPGPPPADILVEKSFTIDDIVRRAITKIAFNYLAKMHGVPFTLHPSFDGIRRFVRHGERPGFFLFDAVDEAILEGEPIEGPRLLGNLVTLDVAIDGASLFAQVSLLNMLTYRVLLVPNFDGERPTDFRCGHYFDVSGHRIYQLGAGEKATLRESPRR